MTDITSSRLVGHAGLAGLVLAASLATADVAGAEQAAEPQPAPAAREAANGPAPRAVLQRYCFACHNERTLTAGLALDVLDMTRPGDHAEVWEAVINKLRTGAMPPAGRPRPDRATYREVVAWLESELDRAALANPDPGRPTLHRLNRTEYRNAVRDLLAVDIDTALLPADNAAYGFDNNADALTLSSSLTERYLGAAARIAEMALGRPRGPPAPRRSWCRPTATRASGSATTSRSARAAAPRFPTTSQPTASTTSSCGPRRAASPAGSRASPPSPTSCT